MESAVLLILQLPLKGAEKLSDTRIRGVAEGPCTGFYKLPLELVFRHHLACACTLLRMLFAYAN